MILYKVPDGLHAKVFCARVTQGFIDTSAGAFSSPTYSDELADIKFFETKQYLKSYITLLKECMRRSEDRGFARIYIYIYIS